VKYYIQDQPHIVKSKIGLSGLMILIIIVVYGISTSLYKYYFGQIINPFVISYLILLLLIFIYGLLKVTKQIKVKSNTITYTNWLTGRSTSYSFDELDGYVELQLPSYGGTYTSILLVQGNKLIGPICDPCYSNYLEIKGGLDKLKYLGPKPFSLIIGFNIFFGLYT